MITVRDATPADLPAVLDIYNYEVSNGVATWDLEPRSLAAQEEWLDEHRPPYCAIVAVDEAGEVLGYGTLSRYHAKPGYRFTVEDSVYVRPDRRREGIGRRLLVELLERAKRAGFHVVLGRITTENEASVELHRALGFEVVGCEREVGFKFGRWLDCLTMQVVLANKDG
jgi:L-amino acid N-acyltransferase